MKYSKKPKYRLDTPNVPPKEKEKKENGFSAEELYREMLKSKIRRRR